MTTKPSTNCWTALKEQNAETLRIIAEADLDTPVPVPHDVPWFPQDVDHWSVRWVALHLIEELSRHAGHADIIRESIDGATMYELMAADRGLAGDRLDQALEAGVNHAAPAPDVGQFAAFSASYFLVMCSIALRAVWARPSRSWPARRAASSVGSA